MDETIGIVIDKVNKLVLLNLEFPGILTIIYYFLLMLYV
ncbi:hypothetical protein HMPREF1311_03736 [Proteus mirabilis WGLW6]|nr:hypothetical protein HMPREF1311_03736 [Proteus mirabilis WGLW6]